MKPTSIHNGDNLLLFVTAQWHLVQPARLQQEEKGLDSGLKVCGSCLIQSTHTLRVVLLDKPKYMHRATLHTHIYYVC